MSVSYAGRYYRILIVRIDSIELQVLNPSRHVFQEKPDFVEYVRRRINVPLKVVLELFLLFSFIFTTKHILWFLFILVLITLLTKFFLRLFLHYRPEDLNLRVGTMLTRCLENA